MSIAKKINAKSWKATAASIVFWVVLWQVASMAVNEVILLPTPVSVAKALGGLVKTEVFWQSIAASFFRIGAGFFLGLSIGCAMAALAYRFKIAEIFFRPLVLLVSATPVASFIILALVWISSRNLSIFISFMMVMPVIYTGVLNGIHGTSAELVEMARLFKVGRWRRVRAIYFPALLPGLVSACELALALAWKSGIAAEIIGLPPFSIGERMHQAKIFLLTPELFAWTAVIILLSWFFVKIVKRMLKILSKQIQKGWHL